MKPLLPPVVMALVRCPIVDYFTIVPIRWYPEQLSGRATPTLPSWIPPAYLYTFYSVPVPCSRTRTNAANDIRHWYSPLSLYTCFFFPPLLAPLLYPWKISSKNDAGSQTFMKRIRWNSIEKRNNFTIGFVLEIFCVTSVLYIGPVSLHLRSGNIWVLWDLWKNESL